MPTRNVSLTDHQAKLLDDLVASGRYQNASEAIRAGLRELEELEDEVAAFKERLARARADADAGRFAEGGGEAAIRRAFARAKERYEEKHKRA